MAKLWKLKVTNKIVEFAVEETEKTYMYYRNINSKSIIRKSDVDKLNVDIYKITATSKDKLKQLINLSINERVGNYERKIKALIEKKDYINKL